MKKYQIIYADPPWNFKTYSDKGKRAKFARSLQAVVDKVRFERKDL